MAQEIAEACGFALALLRASEIPPNPIERDRLARRWARANCVLTTSALYIESGGGRRPDESESLAAFCDRLSLPFAVGIQQESTLEHLPGLRIPQPAV